MTKDSLICLLKKYKENKAKLRIKLKRLKNARIELSNYRTAETNITSAYGQNQDIHSKNKISDKVLSRIENNENRKEKLEAEIEELEKEVKQIRDEVDEVDDRLECLKYKEKEIVRAYYIDGRTSEDIGNNLYFELFKQTRSGRNIRITINESIEKMLKL